MKTDKIVLVTGGFDPIHQGHIEYIKAAMSYGDRLIVGLNSDEWLSRKKGKPFMAWKDRYSIVENLKQVNEVISFDDSDGSANNAIRMIREKYPDSRIIFANGGDRVSSNIPEMDVGDRNISFIFGVGGDVKLNSSSRIINLWENGD